MCHVVSMEFESNGIHGHNFSIVKSVMSTILVSVA